MSEIRTVIGIDPGVNIGIARIDVEDSQIKYESDGIIDWKLFCVQLDALETYARTRKDPITFVVEDFILFGHKARMQVGSRMDASKVIGAIEFVKYRSQGNIELVMQPSSLIATGAKWSGRGTKYIGGHMPDNLSAYNHAHYWLVKNNYLRHRILDLE